MKVSIIVPVYNAEKYLDYCFDSIIKQSYQDFEILFIDDGSRDLSGSICDKYANQFPDKVRAYHIKNSGPSNARNFGIEKASGEYIQFVDADDCITADCLEQFIKEESRYSSDLLIGNAVMVDSGGKRLQILDVGSQGTYRVGELISKMSLTTKAQYLHYIWNKWYKTKIIKKYDLKFDSGVNLGEDFLFNCSYIMHSETITLLKSEIYYYFKRDNQSLTQKFRRDELKRRRKMDHTLVNLYKRFGIWVKNKEFASSCIGAAALLSMESSGSKNCHLKIRDKVEFVNQFIHSEYYEYLMEYRKQRNHYSCMIGLELLFIKCRLPLGFLTVITARNYKNRLFDY